MLQKICSLYWLHIKKLFPLIPSSTSPFTIVLSKSPQVFYWTLMIRQRQRHIEKKNYTTFKTDLFLQNIIKSHIVSYHSLLFSVLIFNNRGTIQKSQNILEFMRIFPKLHSFLILKNSILYSTNKRVYASIMVWGYIVSFFKSENRKRFILDDVKGAFLATNNIISSCFCRLWVCMDEFILFERQHWLLQKILCTMYIFKSFIKFLWNLFLVECRVFFENITHSFMIMWTLWLYGLTK